MKAIGVGAGVLLALLAAGPADARQGRGDPLMLVGPGSAIGATVREVSDEEAKQAKLATDTGAYIVNVDAGTPAEHAGLKAGDIVIEFDGEHVRGVRSFQRLVSETPPNRTVKATIVRGETRKTLNVTPENSERMAMNLFRAGPRWRPNPDLPLRPMPPLYREPQSQPRLGIALGDDIDSQTAEMFGVSSGVLVAAVDRDSAAARGGVKAGDVITAVNGHPVKRASDVRLEVDSAKGTITLTVMRDKKELTLRVTPGGVAETSPRLPV